MTTEGRDYSKEAVLKRMRARTRPDRPAREAAAWALDGLALLFLAFSIWRFMTTGSAGWDENSTLMSASGPAAGFMLVPAFFLARFARPAPTVLGWLWLLGWVAWIAWLFYHTTL